ncbi:DMT family transporter [uncultured Rikenella sp.]|uniref:DMT family transporter n=1 Tax=uncultured Rikenella sp. TaxID=368003 RepID=UPI002613994A|nr:DMT family transporter [uncultured Rikenella sp.]
MNNKTKGYLYGAVSAATYGMNPLFALPLYADGMDADSVLFFRYLLALAILGGMIKWRGRDFKIHKREIFPLATLGILMACSSLTLFLSYTYMAAGIASTMLFVYPIMVALIMAVCFREKVTMVTVACIAFALLGIGLLYQGDGDGTLNAAGVSLVMVSALAYAIYMVWVNRPSLREIPTVKLTFYVLLFGLSVFLVRIGFGQSLSFPGHGYYWGNLVALAVLPTAVSFVSTTKAIQYIGSTPTAILGALEPLTAVFFGVTIFGEPFTIRIFGGILLILLAVTLIISGGRIGSYLVRFRKLFPKLPRVGHRHSDGTPRTEK